MLYSDKINISERIDPTESNKSKECMIFFFYWVFFHKHSRFTGQQGKGEAISLTSLYHFHSLYRIP